MKWDLGNMIKQLKKLYYSKKRNRAIKNEKNVHLSICGIFKHDENLKKYTKKLEQIANDLNELFYEFPEKSSTEYRFIQCMTLKIRDYFEGILFLSSYRIYQSTIPIARSLCESLYLLKYVKKNPQYINEVMTKNEKLKWISEIKTAVKDEKLAEFYKNLSILMHINPQGIKFTHYEIPSIDHIVISQIPLNNYDEFIIASMIAMMEESVFILKEIKVKVG